MAILARLLLPLVVALLWAIFLGCAVKAVGERLWKVKGRSKC